MTNSSNCFPTGGSRQRCLHGYNHISNSLIKNKKFILILANGSKMTAYVALKNIKIMMNIIRTIQPVGQGGFYTEFFKYGTNEHCIVYDCGSDTKGEPKSTIHSAIPESTTIEILFISHLDNDHVNGIKELVKNNTIKRVVLPQIDSFEWYYILADSISKNKNADDSIINTIRTAIRDIPTIIKVKPSDLERGFDSSATYNLSGENENFSDPIESGSQLSNKWLGGTLKWIFMPINNADGQKISKLKSDLELFLASMTGKTIDLSSLTSKEFISLINPHRKEVNEIYKKIFSSTNNASMLLYSGLNDTAHNTFTSTIVARCHWAFCRRFWDYCYYPKNKEACLYTGDSNLLDDFQKKNIKNKVGLLIDRVGLLQIPHHGSINNFSLQSFHDIGLKECALFVSYGTRNKYGHPSTYLMGGLYGLNIPIAEVTETKNSTLYQRVYIRKRSF